MQTSYTVKLDVYEGPFDLLLYLIRKNRMNILDIDIEQITKQYMAHLEQIKELDLTRAGDFISLAATLMQIKSALLLPGPKDEESAAEPDPRADLVEKLKQYRRIKELSAEMAARMQARAAFAACQVYQAPPQLPTEVQFGVIDLIDALARLRPRVEFCHVREIVGEGYKVEDKITLIIELLQSRSRVFFTEFCGSGVLIEQIVVFLALLEVARSRNFAIWQEVTFGPIAIYRLEAVAAIAPGGA